MEINHHQLRKFFTVAAVCSVLGATTTALLIWLPTFTTDNFDTNVLLFKNTVYINKLWILFLHPQFNILASLAIFLLLVRKYPLQAIPGLLFLLIWSYTEMSQQAFLIDALNQMWRPDYLAATDDTIKIMNKTLIHGASAISDSKYFLVLYGFGMGSLLYGLAMIQEQKLGRIIGVISLLIGVLSLCSFVRYYAGLSSLTPYVDWVYTWGYPWLQPLVRILMGIWIYIEANKL